MTTATERVTVPRGLLVSAIKYAQIGLILVAVTAGVKPTEVFGPGEQAGTAPLAVDLLFRFAVLMICLYSTFVAFVSGKIRESYLIFTPFLLWTLVVAVVRQTDSSAVTQIGAYATWILFYIAGSSLFEGKAWRIYPLIMIGAVALSACGGELQHLLGYGPNLGSLWPESAENEFMRIHTGAGGILLDAFTPYCAAVILLSNAGKTRWMQAVAWLLVLWGTANILRGGMLALAIGLIWFLSIASGKTRKRMLPFLLGGVVCGTLLFGGTIAAKLAGDPNANQGEVNTSGRLDSWPQFMRWMKEEPVFGHGPNADIELIAKSTYRDIGVSHNELLSTGINFGLPGIFLLWTPILWLIGSGIVMTLRSTGVVREQRGGATAILIMLGMLSLYDNTLRTPGVMIIALTPAILQKIGERDIADPTLAVT